MKSTAPATFLMGALATLAWVATLFFAGMIGGQEDSLTAQIAHGKTVLAQQTSTNAAIALVNATAEGRSKLEATINRDILTLSNLIAEAGQHAGIPISVVSATPGPGPSLPKGSVLHPSSIIFSVKTSGSYAQVVTALSLLEALPAASVLESVQISRGDTPGMWNANATIGITTGSSLTS